MEIKEFIVCCECGDTPQFSKGAFQLLSRTKHLNAIRPTPDIYHSDKDIDKIKGESEELLAVIGALQRGKEKFSVWLQYDPQIDSVLQVWNLLSGKRIK